MKTYAGNIIFNLVNLIKENPDLPVVPIVDNELLDYDMKDITADFGYFAVREFIQTVRGVYFKDRRFMKEMREALSSYHSDYKYNKISEYQIEKDFDKLPWKKAIIVSVVGRDEPWYEN